MGEQPVEASDSAAKQPRGTEPQGLAKRVASGDEAAFEEMLNLYHAGIAQLVLRVLGWRDEAVDDAVQETFLRAYRGRRGFRGEGSLGVWLMRIAVHACRTVQRRRRMMARQPMIRPPAGGSSDAAALQRERDEAVRRAVRALPEPYREAVALYYLQGLPAAVAAQVLAISPNALNVRLHRARYQLGMDLDFLKDDV